MMKYFLFFILSFLSNHLAYAQDDNIRPFKDVFIPTISQHQDNHGYVTQINIPIPKGFYLYADKTIPIFDAIDARVEKSEAAEKHDAYFGEVHVYNTEHPAVITIYHKQPQEQFELKTQGCEDGVICYPPDKFVLSVASGGDVSNIPQVATNNIGFLQKKAQEVQTSPSSVEKSYPSSADGETARHDINSRLVTHYWLTLPIILLLGIGVSFTACVYPLIPIVTSLVVGKNTSTRRSHALIITYILGMGIAMAVLGGIFGWFQINLQALLQRPWIVSIVALFFALLSLSMFDVYTLQAPQWLQRKTNILTREQKQGSFIGAAIMGALSILVVSPCATPVLTALLLYTAQTTPTKGAIALFVFGIGTGLPLLLFASVFRRFMPKAGHWMTFVKRGLGFLLFGVALWLVVRLLPIHIAWLIWAIYALMIAVYFDQESQNSQSIQRMILRYVAGATFLFAIFATIQMANHSYSQNTDNHNENNVQFTLIHNISELDKALKNADKTIIVDFYADWCLACKVWEKDIWHNPRFTQALSNYHLLKIDMTNYTNDDKALLQTLNLVGPPAVLFYSPNTQLTAPKEKIIGEITPNQFATYLH